MDWKSESMTVERKITSRHGVDSRPLSEWLRVPGALPGGALRLSARTSQAALLAGREEVLPWLSCRPRGITGYRDHSFTRRFHGNTAGAANEVVRPKRRCAPRRNQNCEYSHDAEHRRTACTRTRGPLLDRC